MADPSNDCREGTYLHIYNKFSIEFTLLWVCVLLWLIEYVPKLVFEIVIEYKYNKFHV